jgi:hypothetical protein
MCMGAIDKLWSRALWQPQNKDHVFEEFTGMDRIGLFRISEHSCYLRSTYKSSELSRRFC